MIEYELMPTNGRKSFYGKAKVVANSREEALYSYGTLICSRDKASGKITRHCDDDALTQTTCTHIKSFCGLNKQQFIKATSKEDQDGTS